MQTKGKAAERSVRRVRRIDGRNLQPRFLQRLDDLLRQKLGLFGLDPGVGMTYEERANGRGDDGIHLVQINHLIPTNCELLHSEGAARDPQQGERSTQAKE